jgi:ribosomal protein S18 acetylase RimI-like enzyme
VLYIVLGVLTEAHHRGMGTALMLALEEWASAHGVSRMELRVDVRNVVAKALYEKLGYRVEGTRVACRMIGGRPVDEYDMAKLLPVPANVPRE